MLHSASNLSSNHLSTRDLDVASTSHSHSHSYSPPPPDLDDGEDSASEYSVSDAGDPNARGVDDHEAMAERELAYLFLAHRRRNEIFAAAFEHRIAVEDGPSISLNEEEAEPLGRIPVVLTARQRAPERTVEPCDEKPTLISALGGKSDDSTKKACAEEMLCAIRRRGRIALRRVLFISGLRFNE